MNPFEFATATRIIFGAGTLKEAAPAAKAFGTRVLVVVGKDQTRAEPLLNTLQAAGLEFHLFSVPDEPTTELVTQGADEARERKLGVVISFGGGSVIDAGKAIAALITNDGALFDYLEVVGKGKALEKIFRSVHCDSNNRGNGRGGYAQRGATLSRAPGEGQSTQSFDAASGGDC